MLKRVACFSIGVTILQIWLAPCGRVSGDVSRLSNKRVAACRIEQFGAYNALRDVSQKAHVAIGVEAAIDYKTEPTVVLDFPGGTVADLLNMFISRVPDYRWEDADAGIIHVFRDATHVPLADIMISYPAARNKTRKEVWEDIGKAPEITEWMNSAHCSRRELLHGKEFRNHNDPISIEQGSVTLAQLLDEVAIKSGENYWAILQSTPGKPCQVSVFLW